MSGLNVLHNQHLLVRLFAALDRTLAEGLEYLRAEGRYRMQRNVSIRSVVGLAAILAAGGLSASAGAEQRPPSVSRSQLQQPIEIELTAEELLQVIRGLVASGQYDKADQMLKQAGPDIADQASVSFLKARIAEQRGDVEEANELYRQILAASPQLVRVRLQLARNLFLSGRDRAAKYHFNYALTGDLPDAVRQGIKNTLAKIRARERYRLDFGLSLTPNSNLNGGPDLTSVDLFGLPFELSDEARKVSGFGVTGFVAGSYFLPLGSTTKLRSTASVWRADYSNNEFDDTTATIASGPSWSNGSETIWMAVTGSRRWYGGQRFQNSGGVKMRVEKGLASGSVLIADLEFRGLDFDQRDYDDGNQFSLATSLYRILSGTSRGVYVMRAVRYYAAEPSWSYGQIGLGFGYRKELPRGFSVEIRPDITYRSYDRPHVTFGKQRQDLVASLSLEWTKRDWRLYGFAPTTGYQYTEAFSNLEIFSYSRHSVNFGMARSF